MTGSLPTEGDAVDTHKAILAVPNDPAWPRGCEASSYSTPLAAFETLALTCPTLVSYRGGWFREDAFRPENADGFFERTGGDLASVEYVVNHLHVDEMLFGQRDPMSAEVALAICQIIAFGWRNWARDRYGVAITTSIIENDGMYEVSFSSVTKP
ncbi:hypothetical protein [Brevundimonas sp.]